MKRTSVIHTRVDWLTRSPAVTSLFKNIGGSIRSHDSLTLAIDNYWKSRQQTDEENTPEKTVFNMASSRIGNHTRVMPSLLKAMTTNTSHLPSPPLNGENCRVFTHSLKSPLCLGDNHFFLQILEAQNQLYASCCAHQAHLDGRGFPHLTGFFFPDLFGAVISGLHVYLSLRHRSFVLSEGRHANILN